MAAGNCDGAAPPVSFDVFEALEAEQSAERATRERSFVVAVVTGAKGTTARGLELGADASEIVWADLAQSKLR